MTYELLKFAHLVGLALIAARADRRVVLRSALAAADRPALFAEAVRNIAVFYDGVVVPARCCCSPPGRG